MEEIEIKDIEQHFDGKMLNAWKVNPYTIIVVEDFQIAEEKLKAMSMDEGENRMKVGECDGDHVAYFIYREGEDNFKVDSYSYSQDGEVVLDFIGKHIDDETRKQAENIYIEELNSRNLERIDRITRSGLSVNQVIEMVGEHNILAHEMYEITPYKEILKIRYARCTSSKICTEPCDNEPFCLTAHPELRDAIETKKGSRRKRITKELIEKYPTIYSVVNEECDNDLNAI